MKKPKVFTILLPSFPQLCPSTGMSEKAWVLKLLGVFESLRGDETKMLASNCTSLLRIFKK